VLRRDERQGRLDDIRPLVQHAPAAVDNQPDAGGPIRAVEQGDRLRAAVLVNLEVTGGQAGDGPSLFIGDGYIEDGEGDVGGKRQWPLAFAAALLGRDEGRTSQQADDGDT